MLGLCHEKYLNLSKYCQEKSLFISFLSLFVFDWGMFDIPDRRLVSRPQIAQTLSLGPGAILYQRPYIIETMHSYTLPM